MRVGLIDVDAVGRGKVTFPNLALMKLSAWHKAQGDSVEWYEPFRSGHMDRVYLSRVFGDEYTQDYPYPIDADEVLRGGSGYAITVQGDQERYEKALDADLPEEIDHTFPDYGLYGITDTAYGSLTRGCPRDCDFCHVTQMQSTVSHTVATLDEFWDGQRYIKLLDPNLTACADCLRHFEALAASRALVDFTQGLDVRLMSAEKIDALNQIRWKRLHFAWDRPDEDLRSDFERLAKGLRRCGHDIVSAYVLTNHGSTHEQDIDRIMFLRSLDIQPYVMIYRKHTAPLETRRLQRWCSPFIFWKADSFAAYLKTIKN